MNRADIVGENVVCHVARGNLALKIPVIDQRGEDINISHQGKFLIDVRDDAIFNGVSEARVF